MSAESQLILAFHDYVDEFGLDALVEKIWPGINIGELFADIYNAGLIPEDVMEEFL